MEKKYLKLNDIQAYKTAFNLSNLIWDIVREWDFFSKDTVGKQFIRASDSISANIAEGFGRYSKNDKIRFYRIGLGSIKETLDWNEKAKVRKLLSNENHDKILDELTRLIKGINHLIKFTSNKLTI